MKSGFIKVIYLSQVLLLLSSAPTLADYTLVDLGVLPGTVTSTARDINNQGQVVGHCQSAGGQSQAFLWQDGAIMPLGSLPGRSQSEAYSLNEDGQIIGICFESGFNDDQIATLFDDSGNGVNVDLGTLGGNKSTAIAINNQGQIIGVSKKPSGGNYYATSFNITGNHQNVQIGPSGSRATAISNNGEAVGNALNGSYHGMIFDMSGGTDYTNLGNLTGNAAPRGINDHGLIVGNADSGGAMLAAIFSVDHGITTLGTLGGTNSKAYAANNQGQIVGFAEIASGEIRATIFDPLGAGDNIDLNSLIDPDSGWTLNVATAINDFGWIVGTGTAPNGQTHGFVLIPEPTSLALLALGGVVCCIKKD